MRAALLALIFVAPAACSSGDDAPAAPDVVDDTTSDAGDTAVSTDTAERDTSRPDVPTPDPPQFDSIAPNTGPVDGAQEVTVRGRNFLAPCNVVFGVTDAFASRSVNETTLAVVTPTVEEPGVVDVRVSCRNGDVTLDGAYTFVGPERIVVDAIEPAYGRAAGGDEVTIRGSGFVDDDRTLIALGGQPATGVVFVDETTITCVSPAGTPGPVSLTVELDGEVIRLQDAFTFVAPMSADAISPGFGDIAGGTPVTITGAGFAQSAAMGVRFGDIDADASTFVFGELGDTLSLTAPAGPSEAIVDVAVSTAVDEVVLPSAFAWGIPASVDAMTPSSMLTSGNQRIVLDGAGFREDVDPLAVLIGETEAFDVTWESATQLSFLAPPLDAGVYPVTIAHGLQSLEAPVPLRVVAPLRIDSVAPTTGASAGGDRVTIEGDGFAAGVLVLFGGTPGTDIEVESATRLRVTSPAGTGTATIELRDPPAAATAVDAFTWE